jgi:hypothetical protein
VKSRTPFDASFRSYSIRHWFVDGVPGVPPGVRSAGSAAVQGGAGTIIVDTGTGANKQWSTGSTIHHENNFWFNPQEMIAQFHGGVFTLPASDQGFGVAIGGAGTQSVDDATVLANDIDWIALRWHQVTGLWRLDSMAAGAGAITKTPCQNQVPYASGIGNFIKLTFTPNSPTEGGIVRCYRWTDGSAPFLLHQQQIPLVNGSGPDTGQLVFAYAGTDAGGRVNDLGISRVVSITHAVHL